ncbi:Pentapeptide repeats (8 copies) [compost metagenome]
MLDRARFNGADLTYADLRHAHLHQADLRGATLARTCLHRALTDEAQIEDRSRAIETDPELAQAEDWRPLPA